MLLISGLQHFRRKRYEASAPHQKHTSTTGAQYAAECLSRQASDAIEEQIVSSVVKRKAHDPNVRSF